MKWILSITFLLFVGQASAQSDFDRIARDAVADANLRAQSHAQDARAEIGRRFVLSLTAGAMRAPGSCVERCTAQCENHGGGGGGSATCWEQCSREGFSSSTCAGRCGVDTPLGSRTCWQKCSSEGFSSSTCAERCRVSTGEGSATCWNKCSSEGFSSSTCAPRCGTSTSAGSQACWQKCSSEGFSSATCGPRCGTN